MAHTSYNLIISDGHHQASLFVWRLLWNRSTTKNNLYRRIIIHPDAQFCVVGCHQHEPAEYLFLQCSLLGSLWSGIFVWIDFPTVSPENLTDHLAEFGSLASLSKSKKSLLTMIWCATTWIISKERNNIIFQSRASSASKLLDNVKFLSF